MVTPPIALTRAPERRSCAGRRVELVDDVQAEQAGGREHRCTERVADGRHSSSKRESELQCLDLETALGAAGRGDRAGTATGLGADRFC